MATDRFISGMGNKSTSRTTGTVTRGGQNQTNLRARQGQFMFDDGTPVPAGTLYHMHPEKGPMEGAVHNPNIPGGQPGHRFLTPTNGNGRQTTRMNQPSPQRNMGRTSGYNQGGHVHNHSHGLSPSDGAQPNLMQTGYTTAGGTHHTHLIDFQNQGQGTHNHSPGQSPRMRRGRRMGQFVSLGNNRYRYVGGGRIMGVRIDCEDGNNSFSADCVGSSMESTTPAPGMGYSDESGPSGESGVQSAVVHTCPECPGIASMIPY
mgnify:FL=1